MFARVVDPKRALFVAGTAHGHGVVVIKDLACIGELEQRRGVTCERRPMSQTSIGRACNASGVGAKRSTFDASGR